MKVSVVSGGPSSASSQQDTLGGWGRAAEGSQDVSTEKSEPENRCREPLRAQAVARETSISEYDTRRGAAGRRLERRGDGARGGRRDTLRGSRSSGGLERGAARRSDEIDQVFCLAVRLAMRSPHQLSRNVERS